VHYGAVAQSLVLLTLANGSPVIAKRIFVDHFSSPIDGGTKYMDGRAVFGSSKTIRGVLVSILVTTAGAPLLGLELKVRCLAGITAMAGDLFSSFIKRRLGQPPSSRATGLDQIPRIATAAAFLQSATFVDDTGHSDWHCSLRRW
jgi:CDP-diglyceride synthetase